MNNLKSLQTGTARRPQQVLCNAHRKIARGHVVRVRVHCNPVQNTDDVAQVDEMACWQLLRQSTDKQSDMKTVQTQRGNVVSHVCLCVCLSVLF